MRVASTLGAGLLGALCLSPAGAWQAAAPAGDALDAALALEGLAREDLGWRPKGWWSRFPADLPHKLRHFDDCFAEPLAVVTFARTAHAVARDQLAAAALAKVPEKSDGALYQATYGLGIERRFGGFRCYSANLTAAPTPLEVALPQAHAAAGRETRFVTFGNVSPYPDYPKEIAAKAAGIPEAARPILGRLVCDLLDAWRWVERGFRNVPPATRTALARRLDLGTELTDALDYEPALDDVARTWDEASVWYGGLKTVAALEGARHALAALPPAAPFAFDWETPLGWVRIRGGGDDVIDARGTWLVVDLGGNDRYTGGAAGGPETPVAAMLDLSGDDTYDAGDGAAQGAGACGVGVLLDAAGKDRYAATRCAQGFGQAGLGLCADLAGDDTYFSRYSSQGAGFLGVGLLLDAAGTDSYRIESDGQGFGGAGGVGTLADRAGDDRYEAVRDPAVTGRASYHSQAKVAVSNAQGAGFGRRGDGADGHSWAGGLGQLLDVEGNDTYVSGNWAMGTGYWFGTGILHDAAGNDTYRGVWWTQGATAHFAIGACLDEGGDDRHLVEDDGHNSLSFAHDFGISLLVNLGGKDVYETPDGGLGYSINRSVALFLDVGGDDRYRAGPKTRPGTAVFDERFRKRDGAHTCFADASSLGLFLDVGGTDDYGPNMGADGTVWLDPPDAPNRAVRNFAIGVDRADGTVDLSPRPERVPSDHAPR